MIDRLIAPRGDNRSAKRSLEPIRLDDGPVKRLEPFGSHRRPTASRDAAENAGKNAKANLEGRGGEELAVNHRHAQRIEGRRAVDQRVGIVLQRIICSRQALGRPRHGSAIELPPPPAPA